MFWGEAGAGYQRAELVLVGGRLHLSRDCC